MSHVPEIPITVPSSRRRRQFPWLAVLLIIVVGIAIGWGIYYVQSDTIDVVVSPPAERGLLYENPELIVVRNFEAWKVAALRPDAVIWQPADVPYTDDAKIWRPPVYIPDVVAPVVVPDVKPTFWQPAADQYHSDAIIWQPTASRITIDAGDRDAGAVNPELRIHELYTSP